MALRGSILIDLAVKPKHNITVSGILTFGRARLGGGVPELMRAKPAIASNPWGGRSKVFSKLCQASNLAIETVFGKANARKDYTQDCLRHPVGFGAELMNEGHRPAI